MYRNSGSSNCLTHGLQSQGGFAKQKKSIITIIIMTSTREQQCCWHQLSIPTLANTGKAASRLTMSFQCFAGIFISLQFFFFFCVRCDDRAKSSGRWLLGSPPSAVVRQLAPRAWCPLQCLLAKTVGVLSPGVGRSEECAQGFAPQSHIHSGLNQQDLVSLDVFLAHSDQYADGRWWFGSSCQ